MTLFAAGWPRGLVFETRESDNGGAAIFLQIHLPDRFQISEIPQSSRRPLDLHPVFCGDYVNANTEMPIGRTGLSTCLLKLPGPVIGQS